MCKVLKIPRSSYYYEATQKQPEDSLAAEIREIFQQNQNNYGTRKIKVELLQKRPQRIPQAHWANHEAGGNCIFLTLKKLSKKC